MKKFILFITLFVLLALYQLSASVLAPRYEGFRKANWQCSNACLLEDDSIPEIESIKVFAKNITEICSCYTTSITKEDNILEFEIRGNYKDSLAPKVFAKSGDRSELIGSLTGAERRQFVKHQLAIKEILNVKSIYFELPNQFTGRNRLVIRERISSFVPSQFESVRVVTKSKYFIGFVSLVLAAFVLSVMTHSLSTQRFTILVLIFSFGVHFRVDSFLYYDTWHALARFVSKGIDGIWIAHNEHFLPAFFLYFFGNAKLFGDKTWLYTSLNLIIHALNVVLLSNLITTLSPSKDRRIGYTLGFFFLIHSLHTETLHWEFEGSILLAQSFLFMALLLAIAYLRKGALKFAASSILIIVVSPFLFGNSFSFLGHLLFILALVFLEERKNPRSQSVIKRAAVILLPTAIGLIAGLFIYKLASQGEGHSLKELSIAENLTGVSKYIFVGSQLGTVFRGLGLFPTLSLNAAPYIFPSALSPYLIPEMFFAWIGLLVSLFLLGVSSLLTSKKMAIRYWLCGQAWILCAFILPAIGRFHLGLNQALALRYQYLSLIGLLIMLIPIIDAVILSNKEKVKRVFVVFAFLFLAIQLYVGAEFRYFTELGSQHKNYTLALKDWNQALKKHSQKISPVGYEGENTPLFGLQPSHPDTITPGFHPDQIYSVLHWLSPLEYPKRHPSN